MMNELIIASLIVSLGLVVVILLLTKRQREINTEMKKKVERHEEILRNSRK